MDGVSEQVDAFAQAFSSVQDVPLRVDQVTFNPPDLRTKLYMLEREFRKAKEATTLKDVSFHAEQALRNLKDLGVLKDAEIELIPGNAFKPGTCNVEVNVAEQSVFSYHVGAFVQKSDLSAEGNVRMRNLTGRCDHHSLEVSRSLSNTLDVAYKYRQPRIFGKPWHLQATAQQCAESFQKESSFSEMLRGCQLDLLSSEGSHKIGYELSWLQLADKDRHRRASAAVRSQLGDHVKSALHYTFVQDVRDDPVTPTTGSALKLSTEVSGLTPDVNVLRYVRQTLDWQYVSPVSPAVTVTLDANVGVMLPIMESWSQGKATLIHERFHLGGVGSLRGFDFKGVGPKDMRNPPRVTAPVASTPTKGDATTESTPTPTPPATSTSYDSLGGDICASLRAALNFDLPMKEMQQIGVRGQAFADIGSIEQLSGGSSAASTNFDHFWNHWRMSCGIGLQIPFGASGRLEVNVVSVMKSYGTDRLGPALQFGFSGSQYAQVRPGGY